MPDQENTSYPTPDSHSLPAAQVLDIAFNRATPEEIITALGRWTATDQCPPVLKLRMDALFGPTACFSDEPVACGQGYRMLREGEILERGDEFLSASGTWEPTTAAGRACSPGNHWRRPVALVPESGTPAIATEPVVTDTQRSVRASEPFIPIYRILQRDEPVRVTDEHAVGVSFPQVGGDSFDTLAEEVNNGTRWASAPEDPAQFLAYSSTRMWRRRETVFRFVSGIRREVGDYVYTSDAVTLRPARESDYVNQAGGRIDQVLFCRFSQHGYENTRPPPIGYIRLDASDVVRHGDLMWFVGCVHSEWTPATICVGRQVGGGMLFARPLPSAAALVPVTAISVHCSAPGEDE